jgi:hypothetical protein
MPDPRFGRAGNAQTLFFRPSLSPYRILGPGVLLPTTPMWAARRTFDSRSVKYGFGELDMLVPAYAATIHKSQGSEYAAVIIPVLNIPL